MTSGVGVATSDGAAVGDAGGHGSAATSDPDGDGSTNDGMTPLPSGVGSGMHDGDGLGAPQFAPPTMGPHEAPYGRNPLL